jgi:hypothetical protein
VTISYNEQKARKRPLQGPNPPTYPSASPTMDIGQEIFFERQKYKQMAKSLRSKSKRAARSIKRKLVFAPVEDERLNRLAKKQSVITDSCITDMKLDEDDTVMDVILSKNAIKKLAMSKHQIYKKEKAKKRK